MCSGIWPFLFMGVKVKSYRHVNVLVSIETYEKLKELSYREKKPTSEIVRQGIALVLEKSQTCKGGVV